MKWEQKLVNKKTEHPHVEIRCSQIGVSFLCIVAGDNGYDYKYYKVAPKYSWGGTTIGKNIHIALNGPMQMSFEEWDMFQHQLRNEIRDAVDLLDDMNVPIRSSSKILLPGPLSDEENW